MSENLKTYNVGMWEFSEDYAQGMIPNQLLDVEGESPADACRRADVATHRVYAIIKTMEDSDESGK